MAVNHYFQQGKGIGSSEEQRLYEDIIIEGLKIYGQDIYYLPRTLVNRDIILGEDMLSRFRSAHMVEMYMETTEGFAGEQEIINKFGLEIREDTTFMVAKRRFNEVVDANTTLIKEGRPNEGDILYMPLMNSFFEIKFVQDQEPFFQLSNYQFTNSYVLVGNTLANNLIQVLQILIAQKINIQQILYKINLL
jgi:hypothetical protein